MSEPEKKLPPQKIVINKLRERVDAWRGFPLQNAKVPYPKETRGHLRSEQYESTNN